MPIQIFIHAKCQNNTGLWAYEIRYWEKDGNSLNDIWNSESSFIQNTSKHQTYLKGLLEAILYLNTLTGSASPDTSHITIHLPCPNCLHWLQTNNSYRRIDRKKTKRGYLQFIDAIKIELKNWNVTYAKGTDPKLPYWLLLQFGWIE